jgi:hypothetical protein
MQEDRSSRLNPIAPNLHPRNHEPPRSPDSRLSAETTDSSPPTFNHQRMCLIGEPRPRTKSLRHFQSPNSRMNNMLGMPK